MANSQPAPSLLDTIQTAQNTRVTKPVCSVQKFINTLSETDAEGLETAFKDQDITASTIASVIGINEHTVRRHRRGICSCGKS